MSPPTRIVRLRNPGFPHRGFFVRRYARSLERQSNRTIPDIGELARLPQTTRSRVRWPRPPGRQARRGLSQQDDAPHRGSDPIRQAEPTTAHFSISSLISLFLERREASEKGDNSRTRTLQSEIDDLLREKANTPRAGCGRYGKSRACG
jgi:hypothetical protein